MQKPTMKKAITIDGSKLIAGAPLEFCIILYAALLRRLPDLPAIEHFRWNVGDDAEARLAEVRKVAASDEFRQTGNTCEFGPPVGELYGLEPRIDNFLTYCLPILPSIFFKNEQSVALKSREATDLLQAILAESASGEAGGGAGRVAPGGSGFFLMSYLLSHLDSGPQAARGAARDRLRGELADLRGTDLVDKLVDVLAHQSQQIERLTATVRLLDVFEQYRDVLLKVDEPVFAEDAELATSYELLASEYLPPAAGFHAIEFNKTGVPYRWGGIDGSLNFSCFVDRRSGVAVRLELVYTADPENFDHVKLFDGGKSVPVKITKTPDDRRLVLAELPPRPGTAGITRLTFSFPKFRKLSNEDGRIAAVAFHRLQVVARDSASTDPKPVKTTPAKVKETHGK